MTKEPLPWKWMAIESLQELSFSSQSDVWAFAVTLWEIFSLGSTPYTGLSWSVDFVQKLGDGLRPPMPSLGTEELYILLQECWNSDAGLRPIPAKIVDTLTRIQEKVK